MLSKLNEQLKFRGVPCVDGLTGFSNAVESVFPKTEIQQCIIHQTRSTTQFVSYKDIKEQIANLKLVYKASSEEIALMHLENFDEK